MGVFGAMWVYVHGWYMVVFGGIWLYLVVYGCICCYLGVWPWVLYGHGCYMMVNGAVCAKYWTLLTLVVTLSYNGQIITWERWIGPRESPHYLSILQQQLQYYYTTVLLHYSTTTTKVLLLLLLVTSADTTTTTVTTTTATTTTTINMTEKPVFALVWRGD